MWRRANLAAAVLLVGALCTCTRAEQAGAKAGQKKEPAPWQEYVQSGKWADGEAHFRDALVAECRKKTPSFKAVASLHFGLVLCRHFPQIKERVLNTTAQRQLTAWLLANREFTRAFLLSLRKRDDAGRAFQIIHHLLQASEKRVRQYPQLAIAFAVVWDSYPPNRKFLKQAFAYYTRNPRGMKLDLRAMPHQVSKYVIDTRRPISERVWVSSRYGGSANIGRLYGMIKYDLHALSSGEGPEIRNHPPTLQNIKKYGGVCRDHAVFASEAGKAIGVPSVRISGGTESGVTHAWVGFLRKGTGGYVWDRDSGRIGKEDTSSGWINDPQEGLRVPEHELDLTLAALRYPRAKRIAAHVWCDAAGTLLAAGAREEAVEAMYRSLDACVCDKLQWQTFARLAKEGVIGPEKTMQAISKFADKLKPHPHLAVDAFRQLADTLEGASVKSSLRLYRTMAKRFSKNTEALGRIRLMEGRFLEGSGDAAGAMKVYSDAALETVKCQGVALPLLDNASRLMLERRVVKGAVAFHEKAFLRADRPRRSAYAMHTTWFKIGLRLAKLRALAGDREGHDKLIKRICGYQAGNAEQRQALGVRLAGALYRDINTTEAPAPAGP